MRPHRDQNERSGWRDWERLKGPGAPSWGVNVRARQIELSLKQCTFMRLARQQPARASWNYVNYWTALTPAVAKGPDIVVGSHISLFLL